MISLVIISIIELGCYGIETMFQSGDHYSTKFADWLILDPSRSYQIWRFITYILVHKDVWHIVTNLFWQLAVGIQLTSMFGWKQICCIYIGGAIAGSVAVFSLSSVKPLVGCSGATCSIIGAYFYNLLRRNLRSRNNRGLDVVLIAVIGVLLSVGFIQDICTPVHVPNEFIRPLYEFRYCRIVLSDTLIVHLAGFVFGVVFAIIARL